MRMRNLIKYMSKVNDFRDGFNLKHKLVDILTIAVLASNAFVLNDVDCRLDGGTDAW